MLSCLLNGKRINTFDHDKETLKKWASKDILLCPQCGEPYEYCHGRVKLPYFRHKGKEVCDYLYEEPETEEHVKGKKDIYYILRNTEGVTDLFLEGWIPGTKQRPDIMFNYYGTPCVIEYQCTPISSEYEERHELYQAAGIKDFWICGAQKYFQEYHTGTGDKRISHIEEKTHMYYDSLQGKFYYVEEMDEDEFKHKRANKNYKFIKNSSKNYYSYSYYPSSTGRPSRKYPYPMTKYVYSSNVSLAKEISFSMQYFLNEKEKERIETEKQQALRKKIQTVIRIINKLCETGKFRKDKYTPYGICYGEDNTKCFRFLPESNRFMHFVKIFTYNLQKGGYDVNNKIISQKTYPEINYENFISYVKLFFPEVDIDG